MREELIQKIPPSLTKKEERKILIFLGSLLVLLAITIFITL